MRFAIGTKRHRTRGRETIWEAAAAVRMTMMLASTKVRAVGRGRRKYSRKILRKKNQQDLVIESILAG